MNIEIWLQLVAICFLGAISPGPSLALVVTNTFAGGRTYGIITSLAHGIGIGIWAFLTAVGITGLLVNASGILVTMQIVGACLIAYIGFRTIFSNNEVSIEQNDIKSTGSRTLLRGASEGFLISILNPKIALFFLAIFSHLVQPDSSWTETTLMGVTAAVIDACWYILVALVLTGSNIVKIFQNKVKVASRVSGIFLIFVAVYLFIKMMHDWVGFVLL